MNNASTQPLAAKLRPQSLAEFVGQSHLIGEEGALHQVTELGQLHSMVLWGPPGVGKTTLAHVLANAVGAEVECLSAVTSGVKDIRAVMERAEYRLQHDKQTVLFVDEVHRFNKSQQDAFLPYIEKGTIIFIGATTENPSFTLNNALLSRLRVHVLEPLSLEDLEKLYDKAMQVFASEGVMTWQLDHDAKHQLLAQCDGDARSLYNQLECLRSWAASQKNLKTISTKILVKILGARLRQFDQQGDAFYNQISAIHKSVRGSDPDAALYWFCRMIDGGCDPRYIIRRVIRMASEDIGNADPRGLTLALNAADAYERLGSPEGELAISQAIIYLACAAKSNATEIAYIECMQMVKQTGSHPVPVHLRNAPTQLMKDLDYGKDYRYAHNEPNAYVAGEQYFPDAVKPQKFYKPVDRGLESKIKEKLAYLSGLSKKKE
jgi:putative ATPase